MVDHIIGNNIRRFRLAQSLTLQSLASQLGISYQQLQKYEGGANRIAASRLYDLAKVLNRPINQFFECAD